MELRRICGIIFLALSILGLCLFSSPPVSASDTLAANFTSDVTTVAALQAVQFTDLSSGNPTAWAWDFGDSISTSNTANAQNPDHTYNLPGIYTVTLTVTDGEGGSASVTKTNYIAVTVPSNVPWLPGDHHGYRDCLSCHGALIAAEGTGYNSDIECMMCHQLTPAFYIVPSAGTGGTIYPAGQVDVFENDNQTFTITANSGYQIADVQVDGISQGAISTYTFSQVTVAHSINATFTASLAPVWDVNGDHACNIGDVVKIGLKWGQIGPAGWIAEDTNKDGFINIGDVVVLGLHWGQTW